MREFLIDTLTLGIVTTDLFTENEVQAAENLNNSYESQTSQYSISNVIYLVQQVKITSDNVYIGAMPNGFYKPEEMPNP
ncbi:hypothetical protein [Bacillus xiapuensis]|uniref:hypothetical protein n=1 Tax=Bacillus xiapuensis TaxID=2014075 RepID=UPI000C24C821|nr:hypothetical protein [Bacillus xiapuensis]